MGTVPLQSLLIPTAVIYIVRHGEKPDSPDGEDPYLSERGKLRAKALALIPDVLPQDPDYLFATAVTHASRRPVDTLKPYAKRRDMDINSNYSDAEYGELAKHLKKLVLKSRITTTKIVVCWHHGTIPKLLRELGINPYALQPMVTGGHWDESVFDRVIRLSYQPGGDVEKPAAASYCQRVLFGDQDDHEA